MQAHAAAIHVLEEELEADQGLPLSWYDVLLQLNEAGGRLRMQELARAVLLSKSGVTRLVDRLVREGLVGRQPCASDRRGWLAVLTPEGKARLRKAAPVHLRGIQEHFGALVGEDEALALRAVGDRLLAHLAQLGACDVDEADEGDEADAADDAPPAAAAPRRS
jgi:DNA-binding MarR family transcriptional regulator